MRTRQSAPRPPLPVDGFVRIQREKKGRGGKTVTIVTGLPGGTRELDALLKDLKQLCGAGGTREGSVLEIQGDHRERLEDRLIALGHRVKLAGG
ncbi:MAG: stress response translation initiation inhibitor YciH [Dehalococcoidia bacterium]|nr:MAG: stress response translation initiation inhibitor YciH [Dehalococcoidia bacterium]